MNEGQGEKQRGKVNPLVGVLALIGGPVLGFSVGYLLTRPAGPTSPEPRLEGFAFLAEVLSTFFLGGLLLVLAGTLYALVILTGCFTADYGRPVFKRVKRRLFVANILMASLLLFGIGLLLSGLFLIVFRLVGIGLSPWVAAIVATAVVLNVVLVRLCVWAPFEPRLVTRRLLATGMTEPELERGVCIGISDPDVSGWKKMILEDDVGMLWLEAASLIYRGDAESFEIKRDDLLDIERMAVAASPTAYVGNRHIVLRFKTDVGGERRARLHVEGCWTLKRIVKATDQLADRLNAWRHATATAAD